MYYKDIKSDTLDITCGVPQGSILGPRTIYILYINDMVNVSKLFKFFIFADDTITCFVRIEILLLLV